jgi:hypothetical protein
MRYYCAGCSILVADMQGKIRQDTVMLCSQCEAKRQASDLAAKTAPPHDMPDFMRSIFQAFRDLAIST